MMMMIKRVIPIMPAQKNLEEKILGVLLVAVGLALFDISLR